MGFVEVPVYRRCESADIGPGDEVMNWAAMVDWFGIPGVAGNGGGRGGTIDPIVLTESVLRLRFSRTVLAIRRVDLGRYLRAIESSWSAAHILPACEFRI
jgi:hypothetical protein